MALITAAVWKYECHVAETDIGETTATTYGVAAGSTIGTTADLGAAHISQERARAVSWITQRRARSTTSCNSLWHLSLGRRARWSVGRRCWTW